MRKLIILPILLHLVCSSCPTGFELVKDGQCRGNYTSINTYQNQVMADVTAKCNEIGSQPITIHNQEQQSYWMSHVTQGADVWTAIGLVCSTTTKRWEWVDGSEIDFKPPPGSYESAIDLACSISYSWVIRGDGRWSYFGNDHTAWTTDVLCTTQLHQPPQSLDGCDGFEDDTDDQVCYQIGSTVENWQDAQKTCLNFGANLASIHNLKENSFVRRLAISRGVLNGLYLGGTRSGKGLEFGWIDGTPWDYQNFYSNFPLAGNGDCIAMDTAGSTLGEWINTDCNSSLSFACVHNPRDLVSPACTTGPWTEGQVITSPGFPFEASIACDYMLSVDAGKRVELEINFLEANTCCDHLVLFENYIGGNVLANLTGEISEKVYKTSTSNFMRVSWNPNGGVNVKGLMFTFRAI